MANFITIQWTCGSIDEARKVSRYLVQERLVACAQITPWIESIYMWDNKLETEQETKVVFKTLAEKFDAIKQTILDNCRHEVPEIVAFPFETGHEEFLQWVEESSVAKV